MKRFFVNSAIVLTCMAAPCVWQANAQVINQQDFTNAAEQTVNGVVSIKTYATPRANYSRGNDFFSDPFFDYFFGNPGNSQRRRQQQQPKQSEQRQVGLGSGVILSEDGYIVTNNHVIDGAERIEVTLNDNRNFNATLIGADDSYDLALLKIESDTPLHKIPMGDSENLKVGEWVLAVGNPFGFTSSVTSGIVSAKARNIGSATKSGGSDGIEAYIQTDAAVNSGNSGGALVNLKGELVGINTAIYSQTGTYIGCSFAIPTSIVKKVVNDFREFGAVQRAMLGITSIEVTPELVKEKEIEGVNSGIYVASVSDLSAAKEADLRKGDIIVAINNMPTTNTAQLQEAMAHFSPGDEVEITFFRNGKERKVRATLRNLQGTTNLTRPETVSSLGCAFVKVSDATMRQLQISHGVQVTGLEKGRLMSCGVKDGFIILSINQIKVYNPSDVEQIYNSVMKSPDQDKVLVIKGIYPTGKQEFVAVPLAD